MFYGVALCASTIALYQKGALLVYKLRKRSKRSGLSTARSVRHASGED